MNTKKGDSFAPGECAGSGLCARGACLEYIEECPDSSGFKGKSSPSRRMSANPIGCLPYLKINSKQLQTAYLGVDRRAQIDMDNGFRHLNDSISSAKSIFTWALLVRGSLWRVPHLLRRGSGTSPKMFSGHLPLTQNTNRLRIEITIIHRRSNLLIY